MTHKFNLRVYIEDTDAGGIVYYANYLKFTERARTEMLRDAGIDQQELIKEFGIFFVVRKVVADYLSPARFDDQIVVETSIKEMRRASLVLTQIVKRDEVTLCDCEVTIVAINIDKRAVALPDALLRKLGG